MYCTECGNEIKNDEKFCRNCGKKIEDSSINNVEINNDYHYQFSDEYMSKLAQANNAAQMFLSKEKPTWIDYNQVSAMYGQVEQIGAHINKTYINELDFFIKANLLDYGIYFDTVEKFEKIYDNLMQHALLNTKDENEKEKIKQQYNKKVIIEEFKKKLDVKLQARKKRNKKILLWVVGIIGVIFIFSLINSNKSNKSNYSSNNYTSNNNISNSSSKNNTYSSELSYSEANRLFEATINYLKSNSFIITGNILNDGTYRYIESEGTKYIYAMNVKYNPMKNGYADTTKISSTTVYTFYNSSTDKFSVHYTLSSAQEKMKE